MHTEVKIATYWWGGKWNSTFIELNGCTFEIDGEIYNQYSPCTISLTKGTHSIKVMKEDYITYYQNFDTNKLKGNELRIVLDYKYPWEGSWVDAYVHFSDYDFLSRDTKAYVYTRRKKDGKREYIYIEPGQGDEERLHNVSFGAYKCNGIFYNACVKENANIVVYMNL